MDRVRLSFYCPGCEPGYHMPYLRAAADGVFAAYGLDVELMEPAGGHDNILRVADGGADFCLTSLEYFVEACARRDRVRARFVAVITQHSPIAGIVLMDSEVLVPQDLAHKRVGGPPDDGLVAQYEAALAHLEIDAAVHIPMEFEATRSALRRGDIDVIADFVDLTPQIRRVAGRVRAIPLAIDVYASGLVAADRLDLDLVTRVRDAVVDALKRHRAAPEQSLNALLDRYPSVDPADALESWTLIEPYIFTSAAAPGSMREQVWRRSIGYTCSVHRRPVPPLEWVYRAELVQEAVPAPSS